MTRRTQTPEETTTAQALRTCPDCGLKEQDQPDAFYTSTPSTLKVKRCKDCYRIWHKAGRAAAVAEAEAVVAAASETPAPAARRTRARK